MGAFTNVEVGLTAGTNTYTSNGANRYIQRLSPLSANTALLWYFDTSTGVSRSVVLTENAGVITVGTIVYRSIASTQGTDGNGVIFPPGTSEFLSIRYAGFTGTNNSPARLVPNKISGTTFTYGAGKITTPEELSVQYASQPNYILGRVGNGDYIVSVDGDTTTTHANSGVPVYRSNGDVVVHRGTVKIPSIAVGTYPVPTMGNRILLLGATTFGNTVNPLSSQLRAVHVEIAA
jgi:hypothetical protein